MIECALQLNDNAALYPFAEEDREKIREFKKFQVLRAKLYGIKKPRSLQQLALYWVACGKVADNLEDKSKEQIDFEVKIALKHIKSFKVVEGITYIEVGSISFANLDHIESCNFFDRAFPVMAKMIGITTEELLKNCNEGGKFAPQ